MCDNLALKGTYISPVSRKPLTWDPDRRAFRTDEGGESFGCIAGDIPDFRPHGEPLGSDEIELLRTHLAGRWREAKWPEHFMPNAAACSPPETRIYRWRTWRTELLQFAKYCLRPRRWTQADSMELYRRLTYIYPDTLSARATIVMHGRLHVTSVMSFKALSLEPLAELIRRQAVSSVLDFGCGWGGNTILLRRMFSDLEVWSFDYSPHRTLTAQFNLRQLGLTPYQLFVADGSRMPLADNSVDLVFTSNVLEQMQEVLTPALQEIRRVARRFAVHIEPTFRYADWAHRLRVIRKGYPRDVLPRSLKLGWRLREYRLADPTWAPTPAEWIVLEKQ